jgi:hypothetical protein
MNRKDEGQSLTHHKYNLKELEKNASLIKPRRLDFSKKLAIIYNPNSGKKIDIREQIEGALENN